MNHLPEDNINQVHHTMAPFLKLFKGNKEIYILFLLALFMFLRLSHFFSSSDQEFPTYLALGKSELKNDTR